MQHANTIDADFARLHGLCYESLEMFLDLFSHVNLSDGQMSVHPPPSSQRHAAVQDCFRLRLEQAEKRYLRMKAVVSASLAAQRELQMENQRLAVASSIRRLGLESACSATLEAMGGGPRFNAVAAEMQSLTARLETVLSENEKLVQFNRILRGEQAVSVNVDVNAESNETLCQRIDALTIQVSVQREHITRLELECVRQQSRPDLFDHDERLRECEDVFDRILGRQRLDFCAEDVPGAALSQYHPIATCKDPDCVAYATRLRGGLRKAVTAEYVKERIERLHGLILHKVTPLETLRVEKDRVIEGLQQRISRFEQAMRMTSEEADQVQLQGLSSDIFKAATELEGLRFKCREAKSEYLKWQRMIATLTTDHAAAEENLAEVRREITALAEERMLTENSRRLLMEERDLTVGIRSDMARFQDGRMGAAFRDQKAKLEALQREMEGLRMERMGRPDAPVETIQLGGGDEVMDEEEAAPIGNKKAKRQAPTFDYQPGVGVRVLCKCGQHVPLSQMEAHAQQRHSSGPRRALVCGAGCGFFFANGSRVDLDRHMRSTQCGKRRVVIQRLLDGTSVV
jgi:hypothetical protein